MNCLFALLLLTGCGSQEDANLRTRDSRGEEATTLTESQNERLRAIARVKELGGRYRGHSAKLSFAGTTVVDADLEVLKTLPGIERLSLSGTDITDAGLAHLKGLTLLRELNLSGTQVTNDGLSHLKHLPKLRSLSLNETPVTEEGLQHIMRITQLQVLTLSKEQVSDAGVDALIEALPECDIVRH